MIQEPQLESNTSFYGKSKSNPFADTFSDPLCKLNLKETAEFVKSFPLPPPSINGPESNRSNFLDSSAQKREGVTSVVTHKKVLEAPPTPGRPVFSFSVGNLSRKSFPSKWDDAEKWLINSSCHDSPAHNSTKVSNAKQCDTFKQHQMEVSKAVSTFQRSASLNNHNSSAKAFKGGLGSMDVLPKGNDLYFFNFSGGTFTYRLLFIKLALFCAIIIFPSFCFLSCKRLMMVSTFALLYSYGHCPSHNVEFSSGFSMYLFDQILSNSINHISIISFELLAEICTVSRCIELASFQIGDKFLESELDIYELGYLQQL